MTIRSQMSLIMGIIGPQQLKLFALEAIDYYILLCCSIYKYQPVSSKLGQNLHESKILDEFDCGCNQTRTTGVICP